MTVEPNFPIPALLVTAVSEDKMKTVAALLQDPNPLHWDVESVRASGLGERVINQGPSNIGYLLNMLLAWTGGDASRVRRLRVRFLDSVYAGDDLVAAGVVTGIREQNDERLADCNVWLERANGDRVLDGSATVVVD